MILQEAQTERANDGHGHAIVSQLEQVRADEQRRALRALLRHPLICASGAHSEEFGLIRRHAPWLREWLARNPGWALHLDSEVARLRKTATDVGDSSRGATDPDTGQGFTRRCYVLLCLALVALERSDRQTALGKLAEDVLALAGEDALLAAAGAAFDLSSHDDRRDLVRVIRLLLDLHVLARVQGAEEHYLGRTGDVLYSINRVALSALLHVHRGPSLIVATTLDERLAQLTQEAVPDTDEARNRAMRARLVRRLLDDPILYYSRLSASELSYLQSQRSRLLAQIEEATGWTMELRAEGIVPLTEEDDSSDLSMPEDGTDGHVLFLLVEFLAQRCRVAAENVVVWPEIEGFVGQMIARHGHLWRQEARLPNAERMLARAAVDTLAAFGLVMASADGVVPLPALGRFRLEAPAPAQDRSIHPLLWGDGR